MRLNMIVMTLTCVLFLMGPSILQAKILVARLEGGHHLQSLDDVLAANYHGTRKSKRLRWDPEDIPYYIDPSLGPYSGNIDIAVREFQESTCLRFRRLDPSNALMPRMSRMMTTTVNEWPEDYIVFNNSVDKGCYSSGIGRQGGPQIIGLQTDTCIYTDLIMHQIFHALGFGHEHNRPDREAAITIYWDNVDPDKMDRLKTFDSSIDEATYAEPYDYASLLHGRNNYAALNDSLTTLAAKTDPDLVLGQPPYTGRLSPTDVKRLNAYYSCPATTTVSSTTSSPSTPSTSISTPEDIGIICDGVNPNYADPYDCSRYYVCVGMKATLMSCPAGLYYNSVNYVCDWPSNVYCVHDYNSVGAMKQLESSTD